MIENKNFSYLTESIPDADEYRNCNFTQPSPLEVNGAMVGVPLFNDGKARVFVGCNLINCAVPDGSTVEGCNTTLIDYEAETVYGRGMMVNGCWTYEYIGGGE